MTRKPTPRGPVLDAAPGLRQRQRANGTWRVWWEPTPAQRAAGAAIVEFDAAKPGHATREAAKLHDTWTRAAKGERPAAPVTGRTITSLILDYQASIYFTAKPDSTRRVYRSDMAQIAAKWGAQPVVLFDKPIVALWLESVLAEKGATRARALRAMFSILMVHAELRGWRPEGSNPCAKLKTGTPVERHRTATWDEFDAAVEAARRLRRWSFVAALHLAVMAGQRQYDIFRAVPGDFAPLRLDAASRPVWVWHLVQSKRGKALAVPVHDAALPALRLQLMRTAMGPGTLIWDEATGKAFTPDRFGHVWAQIRAEAAKACPSIATLQWRDLRRTFGNLSRAGGASKSDTADVLGNTAATDPRLMRTYMAAQIATTLRAVQAVQRPEKPKGRKEG